MTHPVHRALIVSIVFLSAAIAIAEETPVYIEIQKVNQTDIIIREYSISSRKTIPMPNLKIDTAVFANSSVRNTLYQPTTNLSLILLEAGIAKIVDPKLATDYETLAQNEARREQKGLWSQPSPPSDRQESPHNPGGGEDPQPGKPLTGRASELWGKYGDSIIQALLYIIGSGLAVLLLQQLRAAYYRRKIYLTIIGEPSTGKTGIYLRLKDPGIERQKILSLEYSRAIQIYSEKNPILQGQYQLYPRLTDIPGNQYGKQWDALQNRNDVIVFVLSPTKKNAEASEELPDKEYLDIQFGYTRGLIAGALSSARPKKPRLVIVFINKFDLLSKLPASDSQSAQASKRTSEMFRRHLEAIKKAAPAKVPVEVIIGSALEGWNTNRILELTKNALYKEKS